MANVYQAQMSDDQSFKRPLLDVITNSTSGIISGVVVGYILKGRR